LGSEGHVIVCDEVDHLMGLAAEGLYVGETWNRLGDARHVDLLFVCLFFLKTKVLAVARRKGQLHKILEKKICSEKGYDCARRDNPVHIRTISSSLNWVISAGFFYKLNTGSA